jgi:SCO1/SenC
VIYFGYTHCPDVCPTELQAISLALDELGMAADRVQPLFITVDPERDTPSVLADYVSSFHARLFALTGPATAIQKVTLAYRVFFAKSGVAGPDGYAVDHTGFIYLVGKDGRYGVLRRTLQNLTFSENFAGLGQRASRHDQKGPGRRIEAVLANRRKSEAAAQEALERLAARRSPAGSGLSAEAWRNWDRSSFITCPAAKRRHTDTPFKKGL